MSRWKEEEKDFTTCVHKASEFTLTCLLRAFKEQKVSFQSVPFSPFAGGSRLSVTIRQAPSRLQRKPCCSKTPEASAEAGR